MRRKEVARRHETTGMSTLVRLRPGLAVYVRGTTVANRSGGHSGWSRVLVTESRRCGAEMPRGLEEKASRLVRHRQTIQVDSIPVLAPRCCLLQHCPGSGSRRARALQRRSFIEWRRLATS